MIAASSRRRAPPTQDRSCRSRAATRLPRALPPITAAAVSSREKSRTNTGEAFPMPAPKPTARPSRDMATARDAASAEDRVLDASRSASGGSAYMFRMNWRLNREKRHSLFSG